MLPEALAHLADDGDLRKGQHDHMLAKAIVRRWRREEISFRGRLIGVSGRAVPMSEHVLAPEANIWTILSTRPIGGHGWTEGLHHSPNDQIIVLPELGDGEFARDQPQDRHRHRHRPHGDDRGHRAFGSTVPERRHDGAADLRDPFPRLCFPSSAVLSWRLGPFPTGSARKVRPDRGGKGGLTCGLLRRTGGDERTLELEGNEPVAQVGTDAGNVGAAGGRVDDFHRRQQLDVPVSSPVLPRAAMAAHGRRIRTAHGGSWANTTAA